jgi:hypothetical protein
MRSTWLGISIAMNVARDAVAVVAFDQDLVDVG